MTETPIPPVRIRLQSLKEYSGNGFPLLSCTSTAAVATAEQFPVDLGGRALAFAAQFAEADVLAGIGESGNDAPSVPSGVTSVVASALGNWGD